MSFQIQLGIFEIPIQPLIQMGDSVALDPAGSGPAGDGFPCGLCFRLGGWSGSVVSGGKVVSAALVVSTVVSGGTSSGREEGETHQPQTSKAAARSGMRIKGGFFGERGGSGASCASSWLLAQ